MRTPAVPPAPTFVARGFTLVELAIVMFVVALLLGGMLLPLASQQDIRNYGDTQKILAEARDALLGFAMANDRLPCPAANATTGIESPVGGGTCTNPGNAATAACAANTALATDAVAVIYSLGKNAVTGGTTADELPNVTADRAFVNAPQGPLFDDQMLWLSKSTLFNRLVAAGRLP